MKYQRRETVEAVQLKDEPESIINAIEFVGNGCTVESVRHNSGIVIAKDIKANFGDYIVKFYATVGVMSKETFEFMYKPKK